MVRNFEHLMSAYILQLFIEKTYTYYSITNRELFKCNRTLVASEQCFKKKKKLLTKDVVRFFKFWNRTMFEVFHFFVWPSFFFFFVLKPRVKFLVFDAFCCIQAYTSGYIYFLLKPFRLCSSNIRCYYCVTLHLCLPGCAHVYFSSHRTRFRLSHAKRSRFTYRKV